MAADRQLRLRQLEVFRAVMAHGTVTAAAAALRMSQPAATSALRAFERSLGFALFERLHGRLRPAPEALSLYEEVDRLFRNVAVIERYAYDLKEAQSGVLTIASTHSLSCDVLAHAIARFRDEHPRVQVWLQVTTTREIIDQARKRQIDFGLIYAPADEHGLRVQRLGAAALVCVLRPDHPLATRPVLRPRDLRHEPLIINVRNDPILEMIEAAFRPHGVRGHARIGTNNTSTACALVSAGAGIALVEPFGVDLLFPSLARRPFLPRIAVDMRVVSNAEHPMSRLAGRFVQRLRAIATERLRTA
jgi:DNA-binding transcriptional LysR family regulator